MLAVERLAVRSAVITSVEGLGISQWTVAGSPPDPVRLRDRLAVALRDDTDLVRRLAARDSSAAKVRVASRVDLLPGASETATVLQVRAHDRPGLLYDVTSAIASTGADIRSPDVSTLGAECVDVFYLTDNHGGLPLDDEDARTTAKTILDRLTFSGLQCACRRDSPASSGCLRGPRVVDVRRGPRRLLVDDYEVGGVSTGVLAGL